MATEKIVFETEVKTGNSGSSVKGLKQELRELTKQLGTLEQGSEAFNQAARRAGQLKEQIRGVNDAIENADPEKKFAPFSRTIQGLAGGFAAAQGAMALFGAESEDLEKTLVKVQGAMALSQGLNSLIEFKNDFKDLGGIIVKNVVKAFTTLKGAIAATGIGLLVITIGTLITNWKEFSKTVETSIPGFKTVTDFFGNLRQVGVGALKGLVEGFKVVGDVVAKLFQGDFSGAIDSAKEFGARVAVAYNEGYAEEDRKIKIENGLKDRKFALDLEEAKGKDVRAKRIKLMQDELSLLEKGSEEYNSKLIEIETLRTEIKKEGEEKRKKIDEGNAAYAKEFDKRMKALADEAWQKEIDSMTSQTATKVSLTEDEANKLLGARKLTNEEIAKLALMSYEQQLEYIKKLAADEKNIDEKKKEAKLATIAAVGDALGSLGQIAGEQTAAGKSLAVASATIDTYVGATKAYAQGGVLGFISAAAVIAAGLANVRRILSVQVPKSSGSNPSLPSAGGQSVPQFNPAVAQQVQGGGDITLGQKPQRVYVVESDIRGTMNKVDVIEANATIG